MHSTEKRIQYNDQATSRLDRFLTASFNDAAYTRSYWSKMIDAGLVKINGSVAQKAGSMLRPGDSVEITWPTIDVAYRSKVNILYADSNVLVLNKPAGMLTHSKGAFNPEYTVADYVAEHSNVPVKNNEANTRAGIVHRLDRLTSGVIITALSTEAETYLQEQFARRKTEKRYVAIVEGAWHDVPDRIDIALRRSLTNPKKQEPHHDGRSAETVILGTEIVGDNTVIYMQPITGRTHQLRVHLSYLGYPIVGDTLYGAAEIPETRILLHAQQLTVNIPGASNQTFVAPIPDDMASYTDDGTIKRLIERAY